MLWWTIGESVPKRAHQRGDTTADWYLLAIEQLKNWVVHTAYATLSSGKYKWQVGYSMVYHRKVLHNYFITCHRKYSGQHNQWDICADLNGFQLAFNRSWRFVNTSAYNTLIIVFSNLWHKIQEGIMSISYYIWEIWAGIRYATHDEKGESF